MAQTKLFSAAGAMQDKTVKLDEAVFEATPNHNLIKQAYGLYLSNSRHAGAKTLTRGLVRGGGRKPWKQKGTGRARAGSSRLPHWTGGGVAFGPTGAENFLRSLPVKAKRAATRQALSLQTTDDKIMVIENFTSKEGKVKPTVELLRKLNVTGNVLLVVAEKNDMIDRATRNVAGVNLVTAQYLNVFQIINADTILITQDALKAVTAWLTDSKAEEAPAKTRTKKTEEVAA